jgi:hypothetical protein
MEVSFQHIETEQISRLTGRISGVSILSDFLLASLPAYFLRTLQMRRRLKIAVGSLMALGLMYVVLLKIALHRL